MFRTNKRGQGSTQSFSTELIIAAVFLVVVLVAIYFGYNYIKNAAKLSPEELIIAEKYCENSLFKSDIAEYCGTD